MYSLIAVDGEEIKKAKGFNENLVKNITASIKSLKLIESIKSCIYKTLLHSIVIEGTKTKLSIFLGMH